jgi:histidinol-phosphatase (PHP family)
MSQFSNYHGHCTYCDGHNSLEEFVVAAIKQGFRAYGFSSHSPLPFETIWNMSTKDMPNYLAEINQLKHKYADQIELYAGLEIDYLDASYNASIPYFKDLPLDYRISSIHFLPIAAPLLEKNTVCIDGPYDTFNKAVELYFGGSILNLIQTYYDNSMQMVEAGAFDIVGHADKIYMNAAACPAFDFESPIYKKAFADYIHLIAEKGLMMEINTKNWTKKGHLYPRIDELAQIKQLGIPVMVNSDAHYVEYINNGLIEVLDLLKQVGFKSTRELIQGVWQDVSLV